MIQVLYIEQQVEPFTAPWGSICQPVPYEDGYTLPLGWEEELESRSISYSIIEIELPNEQGNLVL